MQLKACASLVLTEIDSRCDYLAMCVLNPNYIKWPTLRFKGD